MKTIITHKLTNGLLLLFTALLLSACADSDNNNYNNDSLTVTSYNMGLALNFVPNAAERLVANEDLVQTFESDVICFQEVWLDDQVDVISSTGGGLYILECGAICTRGARPPCQKET